MVVIALQHIFIYAG